MKVITLIEILMENLAFALQFLIFSAGGVF